MSQKNNFTVIATSPTGEELTLYNPVLTEQQASQFAADAKKDNPDLTNVKVTQMTRTA